MKEENKSRLISLLQTAVIIGYGYMMTNLGKGYKEKELREYYKPIIQGLEMASLPEVHASDKRLYEQIENWYKKHNICYKNK